MLNWSFAVTVISNDCPAAILAGTLNPNVTATPGMTLKLFDVAAVVPVLAAPIV